MADAQQKSFPGAIVKITSQESCHGHRHRIRSRGCFGRNHCLIGKSPQARVSTAARATLVRSLGRRSLPEVNGPGFQRFEAAYAQAGNGSWVAKLEMEITLPGEP